MAKVYWFDNRRLKELMEGRSRSIVDDRKFLDYLWMLPFILLLAVALIERFLRG